MLKSLEEVLSTLDSAIVPRSIVHVFLRVVEGKGDFNFGVRVRALQQGDAHELAYVTGYLPSRLLLSICAILYFAYPPLLTFPS